MITLSSNTLPAFSAFILPQLPTLQFLWTIIPSAYQDSSWFQTGSCTQHKTINGIHWFFQESNYEEELSLNLNYCSAYLQFSPISPICLLLLHGGFVVLCATTFPSSCHHCIPKQSLLSYYQILIKVILELLLYLTLCHEEWLHIIHWNPPLQPGTRYWPLQ